MTADNREDLVQHLVAKNIGVRLIDEDDLEDIFLDLISEAQA